MVRGADVKSFLVRNVRTNYRKEDIYLYRTNGSPGEAPDERFFS